MKKNTILASILTSGKVGRVGFIFFVAGMFGSCGGYVEYGKHDNPFDAIYESTIDGVTHRIVLSNPQKNNAQQYTIAWNDLSYYEIEKAVLYVKNGEISQAEITDLKENKKTLGGNFSAVTPKDTAQSVKLPSYSGIKTFVVGQPYGSLEKAFYSNIIVYDFNQ